MSRQSRPVLAQCSISRLLWPAEALLPEAQHRPVARAEAVDEDLQPAADDAVVRPHCRGRPADRALGLAAGLQSRAAGQHGLDGRVEVQRRQARQDGSWLARAAVGRSPVLACLGAGARKSVELTLRRAA